MKKEKSPAFQWYPKDILASQRVAIMNLAEEGAYRRALDYCWLHNSLPTEPRKLAAIIGKRCTIKIAETVKSMFYESEGRLFHERLEKERLKQAEFSEKQKTRAEKRWNTDATAMPRQSRGSTGSMLSNLQSPSSDKEKIYKKENFKPPEVFEVENYFIDQKVEEPQKVASDFFDYWSTRGWVMKSGHSMKNWKSACSTWIKNLTKFKNGKETEQKIGRNTVSDITEFVNRRTVPNELL